MNINKTKGFNIILLFVVITILGCNRTQEIKASNENTKETVNQSEVFGNGTSASSGMETSDNDLHTVVVVEILPTEKYVYLKVNENNSNEYWIATLKQEVVKGEAYVFSGGLLKTNFKSIEHNRIFEKLYLVNRILPANHGENGTSKTDVVSESIEIKSEKIVVEGSISIASIVANPKKYANKIVQVSGVCVKVNPNIMDKNWMHLKDGSKDDYDFVVTSDKAVPVGHKVTFKGTITVNKDFGAGYQYDIIMEDGIILDK